MFIPSIAVLIIGALICFFVLPRMSPYVLGVLCVVMFGLGVWQHYTMFPYEYRTSMVSDMLKEYAGFIMLLAVIFAGLLAMGLLPSSNSPGNNALISSSILPEMKMPNVFSGNSSKNSSKSIFNLSGNSANTGITGTVETAVNNLSKTVNNFINPTNQTKSNSLVSPSFKVS